MPVVPKPIEVKPQQGGRLAPSLSSDTPGIANYTEKRNWRRLPDREIRVEGFVLFCPALFDGEIPMPTSDGDITLIVPLINPDGRDVLIVGTATTIWRYTGVDDPLYVDEDYVDDDYVDGPLTAWTQIGSGFSSNARRWEAETMNGWLVLNNGVDLPITYRITEDSEVRPIYEMREQGIASIGTISNLNGILICCDIRQLKEQDHLALMTPIDGEVDTGQVGAPMIEGTLFKLNNGTDGVEGNTLTADNSLFNSAAGFVGMVGAPVRLSNGISGTISAVADATHATLTIDIGGADLAEPYQPMFLLTGTPTKITVAAATLFPDVAEEDLPGLRMWWEDDMREIVSVQGGFIYVHDDGPIASGPVKLENPDTYSTVTDPAMIDRIHYRVAWPMADRPRRWGATVPGTVGPASQILLLDYPLKSLDYFGQQITVTGMASGNITEEILWNDGLHVQLQDNAIRNFYDDVLDAIDTAESNQAIAQTVADSTASTLEAADDALAAAQASLTLAKQAEADNPSDEHKQDVADAEQLVADSKKKVDDARSANNTANENLEKANTALEEAEAKLEDEEEVDAIQSDTIGSIIGFEDLQDDGTGILKAAELRGWMVLYKESGPRKGTIFLMRYTGVTETPFAFQKIDIPIVHSLVWRNTLITVNGLYHLYAGATTFVRFDLTNQMTNDDPVLYDCGSLFFGRVSKANIEKVFSVDCPITSEIFVCFPTTTDDKCLRYDYDQHQLKPIPTVSTGSFAFTSGAWVTQPGGTESWFVMGASAGNLYKYGLVEGEKRDMVGNASKSGNVVTAVTSQFTITDMGKTILFRNGQRFAITKYVSGTQVQVAGSGNVLAQPFAIEPACWSFNGSGYDSVIQSGMGGLGSEVSEKLIERYEPLFSNFSPNTPVDVTLRVARNLNEEAGIVSTGVIPPETLVPLLGVVGNYVGDKIEVAGQNNPVEMTGRYFSVAPINSRGFTRRPTR